jgi:hypothetical protein
MKGKNTFAGWQESEQLAREEIIHNFLEYLRTTRIRAETVTALADLVARHIASVQGEPCSPSTLLRNKRYKSKLLTHQALLQAPGAKAIDRRSVTDPAAKALITTSELAESNLAREVERLRIYAASLESEIDMARNRTDSSVTPALSSSQREEPLVSDAEFRFIKTCQALLSLVKHFELLVDLDTGSRRILDKSKRRDNVIVDKELSGAFFGWLARTPESYRR